MEQQRLIIALVLSFAVFFAWNLFFTPEAPENAPAVTHSTAVEATTENKQASSGSTEHPTQTAPSAAEQDSQTADAGRPARTIQIDTPLYAITLSEKGAAVIDMTMKNYRETVESDSPPKKLLPKELKSGTCLISFTSSPNNALEQAVYHLNNPVSKLDVQREPASIEFSYTLPDGVMIQKAYRFVPDSYLIDVAVTLKNGKSAPMIDDLKISLLDFSEVEKSELGFIGPSGLLNDKLKQTQIKEIGENSLSSGKLRWIALEQPYFMSSLVLKEASEGQMVLSHQEKLIRNQMVFHIDSLAPGETKTFDFDLFMGPKSWSLLRSYDNELNRAIYFGWVDVLAKPCLWFMNYVHKFIPNYGIAIIILTIITRIAFWPLAHKSYKSMNDMRKLQPLMQDIREKYKNDKARINQETMALYRTYKINPMGGCLPMLVQLPVFFALYRMLYSAIELRHAPFFGWINDLSAPDRLFSFTFKIPLMNPPYGIPVLTLIMGATMLLQQKMTPTPGDPAQAKMMMFMPVIFTVIFINFSSGLVLYWLVGNIISISQQYYTQKKLA